MYNTNDERIKSVASKIDDKLNNITKIPKDFKTNLHLTLNNITSNCNNSTPKVYNFHVLSVTDLTNLKVELHMYEMSADDLGVDYIIGGYNVKDWISDIDTMVAIKTQEQYIKDLKTSKETITNKLSEEAKLSDLLDSLESQLN